MQGTIKTLTDKGFGFIHPDDNGADVFFHSSALVDIMFDQLRKDDAVTFDIEDSPKGPRAANVRKA